MRFDKVLIANRGEIACRLIEACKTLGLKTVAIYSDADKNALHVEKADEAICVGAGPASESYLKVEAILEACKKTGAKAVHPGYGFLSERAHFAETVIKAGLVWVGPSPKVIDLMGNKIAAKKAAEKAKVPTIPWALLKDGWTEKDLLAAGKKVGYPLLLKAAAGGGGRGMRLTQSEKELPANAESAMREAEGAFGSGEIFLEKYSARARHIEVQILGDSGGNVLCLGERDCSSQRRHQKVLEEAPAANLSAKTRKALWKAAVDLATDVGYVNAGTCEFLVDDEENIYFLEMNTRLQVEHPVTENVWRVDLPALQFQVASGETLEKLGFTQNTLAPSGHAIEVRLYAEDPSKGFMPSPGVIQSFKVPSMPDVRIDTGYAAGKEVPIFYDAMLAKIIAWGMTREQARLKLLRALDLVEITGVATNLFYLKDLLQHKDFIAGTVHTSFLGEAFSSWKGKVRMSAQSAGPTGLSAGGAGSGAHSSAPTAWEYFGDPAKRALLKQSGSSLRDGGTELGEDEFVSDGPLKSEYPGKVLKVKVKSGQKVKKSDVLIVCESMKMEFSYSAPFDTTISKVLVNEGQVIPAGTLLVEWDGPKS